jgi:DNA-binding transcriptional LysR family regulator
MTDFQIQCFLTLAAYQSFTRAAEVLGISQPALTHQIAALEKRLGMELFKRTRRGVVLTPEGRIMHAAFKETEQKIVAAMAHARQISEKNANMLYVGIHQDWRLDGFMGALIDKCLNYQDLFQLELRQLGDRDLLEALQEGSVDLILDLDNSPSPRMEFRSFPILSAREYIVHHPSGVKTPPAGLNDFRNQTFVLISQDPDNDDKIDQLTGNLGFRPAQTIFVNSAEAQYLSVKCDMGIALISDLSRNYGREDLAYFPTGHSARVVIASNPENTNQTLVDFFIHTIASQVHLS